MRISDWSSDVCSSDLRRVAVDAEAWELGVDDGVARAEAVADAHQVDEQVVGGHLGEIEVPEHGVHPVDPLVVPDAARLAEGPVDPSVPSSGVERAARFAAVRIVEHGDAGDAAVHGPPGGEWGVWGKGG